MKKKILISLVILLFAAGIVWAENNTTEDAGVDDSVNYIVPVTITNNGIEFSDGFTGFCIDTSKDSITTSDKFILGSFSKDEMENNVKLAIIECYRQGKEDALGDILSHINDRDSNNPVLKEVFGSNEEIEDTAVVEIDNTTEATFDFELLLPDDDSKSACVGYKVSLKTIEAEENPTADDDENSSGSENIGAVPADDNTIQDSTDKDTADTSKTGGDSKDKKAADKTKDDSTKSKAKKDLKDKKADDKTKGDSKDKKTEDETNNTDKSVKNDLKENKTSPDNTTTPVETNRTIVNKTTTVIVNETNTTIINNNNVKTVNNTDDAPQNDTFSNIMKAAGNPIAILIIVIAVIAVAVVAVRRKG